MDKALFIGFFGELHGGKKGNSLMVELLVKNTKTEFEGCGAFNRFFGGYQQLKKVFCVNTNRGKLSTLMKQSFISLLTLLTFVCFGTPTKVTRIIDGDTFETETGEKVRLIGVNAPEITDIFGEEAKKHLAKIIEGQTVDLVTDQISNDRDRYNRLLRYVVFNGVDINKQMLLDGYAFAYLKYHFVKESEYKQAQLEGKKNNNGIWGNSNKENVIKKKHSETPNFWYSLSLKIYVIAGLILLLIIIGFLWYYKK